MKAWSYNKEMIIFKNNLLNSDPDNNYANMENWLVFKLV